MAHFRKKPVVIEAVQITDATFDDPHPNPTHIVGVIYDPIARQAIINTLEGEMRGNVGDWIIRGVKGELYPCKPDIFAATYDPAPSGHPILDKLEPETGIMPDGATLTSIAISAKRIADFLETSTLSDPS